jgi:hypothetical protein
MTQDMLPSASCDYIKLMISGDQFHNLTVLKFEFEKFLMNTNFANSIPGDGNSGLLLDAQWMDLH